MKSQLLRFAFALSLFCSFLLLPSCEDGLDKFFDSIFVKIPPNADNTPPVITWEVIDLNDPSAVKQTFSGNLNELSVKVGSYYGITVYCMDDDGGVKIFNLNREATSECIVDGTVYVSTPITDWDIQDYSGLTDFGFKTLMFSKKVVLDEYGCGRRDFFVGTLGATTDSFKAFGENYRGGKANSELRFNILR